MVLGLSLVFHEFACHVCSLSLILHVMTYAHQVFDETPQWLDYVLL